MVSLQKPNETSVYIKSEIQCEWQRYEQFAYFPKNSFFAWNALFEHAIFSVIQFHTTMAYDNQRKNWKHSVRMGTATIDSARKQAYRVLLSFGPRYHIDFFSFLFFFFPARKLFCVGVYVVASCVFRFSICFSLYFHFHLSQVCVFFFSSLSLGWYVSCYNVLLWTKQAYSVFHFSSTARYSQR